MLDGYARRVFTAPLTTGDEVSHDVYTRGEGPVVVLVQELPGIGKEMLRLADLFVEDGFTVVMPHLFGPLGKTSLLGNMVRVFCLRREFHLFARRRTSPIAGWLRALCRDARDRHGVPGVAMIGMCLTGNFAMSLVADEAVLASMASQPAMPFAGPGALHMSDDDVAASRAALDVKGPMLAYRFETDPLSPRAKFKAVDAAFNDGAERVSLRELPGAGHSVLTIHFVNEDGHPTRRAYEEIRDHFAAALRAA